MGGADPSLPGEAGGEPSEELGDNCIRLALRKCGPVVLITREVVGDVRAERLTGVATSLVGGN